MAIGDEVLLEKRTKKTIILIAVVSILLLAGIGVLLFSMKQEQSITYKNPIGGMTNIGDPFVLKDEDQYYMYATSAATIGFRAWQSDNMVDWEEKGLVYDIEQQTNQWATGDF